MQGGVGYLRNINLGASKNFFIEVVSDQKHGFGFKVKRGFYIGINPYEVTYRFEIKFNKRGLGYEIAKDEVKAKYNIFRLKWDKNRKSLQDDYKIDDDEIILAKNGTRIKYIKEPNKDLPLKKDALFPATFAGEKFPKELLLMEMTLFRVPFELKSIFDISINDFDPKLPKRATPITGRIALEEDGSNLALVIENIIGDKDKRRKFINLLRDILPIVSDLDVEKFADKSLLIKLSEMYSKKYLPASFISDGTLNMVALIIALYFDRKKLSIIEEPERNIHPYLISRVANMMKDASKMKQLIVTTHNPEMVKYTSVEDILLLSRNKEGFSVLSRPIEKESIKKFLENEIGIEEIFSKNLFGE